MHDRDTHFVGFARLLIDELISFQSTDDRPRSETVIARRAYDLVYAVCEAIDDKQSDYEARITLEAMIDSAPDLTAWPAHKELPHG